MAEGASPLDDALESVQREDLGGSSAPPASPEGGGDPFAPPKEPETPAPKKRGRPANPNGRAAQRARARAERAGGAPQSGPVSDPPVPELKKEYPKIPAEAVAESIRRIDERISAAFGTSPLTDEEAQAGGAAFAPVLDHYMPMLTEQGGIWVAPLTFILLAYGPRAWEKLEQRQRDKKRGLTSGAQPGEKTGTDFPRKDENARPFSVVGQ